MAILAAFVIPARVVLEPAQQPLSLAMDAAVTALFGIDLVLRLRWRRSAGGSRASNRWWLAVDILSALPLGRALGLGPAGLLRLIKTTYLFRYVGGWRRRTLLHPVAMRLGFFSFWMSLSAHWLACGWIYLGGPSSDLGTDSVYLGAIYWCVTTLTTVGYGDITPSTPTQAVYTMVVMLLGVGVYGYVIGNAASLLSKLDSAGTVEVLAPDGTTVLQALSDGDFFGELALLHQQRRTATVRAVGYCDLYVLEQDAFDAALTRYPDFAEDIRRISEERTATTETG